MTVPARGRPRSAEADRAILDAALRALDEHGYTRMSLEGVAEAAGVGKTTIYRRYTGKADLATAAIASLKDAEELPDSGDSRADLVELLERVVRGKARVRSMQMLGSLMGESERSPELVELFRERVIAPRRKMLVEVIERGRDRGELRADIDPPLVVDMLVGAHHARQMNGAPFPPDWPTAVVGQLWPALAAPARLR